MVSGPWSVEMRCPRHMHGVFTVPDGMPTHPTGAVVVRCHHCRRLAAPKVEHTWYVADLVAAIRAGDQDCHPSDPSEWAKRAA